MTDSIQAIPQRRIRMKPFIQFVSNFQMCGLVDSGRLDAKIQLRSGHDFRWREVQRVIAAKGQAGDFFTRQHSTHFFSFSDAGMLSRIRCTRHELVSQEAESRHPLSREICKSPEHVCQEQARPSSTAMPEMAPSTKRQGRSQRNRTKPI